ncbi:MAG: class I SAM-dependent methyltransferase [Burkholderiales bacterium]
MLGIQDASPASLKRFDDWYFAYYPYLFVHIPFYEWNGKDVLEVGLGYGTVSQRLAEWGARYRGLDIAAGPAGIVNQRLRQAGLPGEAIVGSILDAPFDDASFDHIVAIGCLHHTGDMQRAIDECYRLLRPGGSLVFMVYYAYSYRRFMQARGETIRYGLRELFGYRGVVGNSRSVERAAYDSNKEGDAAPHTDWISARSLRYLCRHFTSLTARTENIAQEPPFQDRSRYDLLLTRWPNRFGLDLYGHAVK